MRSVLSAGRAIAQGSPFPRRLPTGIGRIEFNRILLCCFRAARSLQAASHLALRRRSCLLLLVGFASPTGRDFHALFSWFFVRTQAAPLELHERDRFKSRRLATLRAILIRELQETNAKLGGASSTF